MPPDHRLPEIFTQQFKRLHDRLKGVSVAGGMGLTLFVVCVNIAIVLILDLMIDLPVLLRAVLLISVPVTLIVMALVVVVRPLLRKYDQAELAAVVEDANPDLHERLLSIVELEKSRAQGEDVGSDLMRSMLIRQTLEMTGSYDFVDVVDARRAIRRVWMGGIAVFALMLPLVFATNAYAVLFSRFINPWGNYERVQNLILTIDDPDRVVGRGDDVTVIARPSWRFRAGNFPEAVWFDWWGADGKMQSRRMDWDATERQYAVTLPRVENSFDYQVSEDHSTARRHLIEVVDRPAISQFSVEVVPPAYTGLAAEQIETVLTEIHTIEQSQVFMRLRLNKSVSVAEILWLESEFPAPRVSPQRPLETVNGLPVRERTPLTVEEEGRSATLHMKAALQGPGGRFVIRVQDEYGLTARDETVWRMTIEPDRAPVIAFADQEQHPSARPHDMLRIPLEAADDFGLAGVELHYDVTRNGIKESGVIPVDPSQLGKKVLQPVIDFDLGRLDLKPGMQVALRARATDERPFPAPNESWTGARLLQIQEDARPYGDQTLADQQHRVDQAMDHLKAGLDQRKQEARKLQDQAQRNEARQEEWRSDAQAAALEENIRELGQQMQKLSAVLDTQPIMQPLAEQARQLAEKELAQAAALAEEARKAEMAQKQQKFSEAADRLQKAQEQLHKVQEHHHELAQMQRDLLELNRLAENTEQLAVQVDDLTQRKMQSGPSGNVALQDLWNQDHQRLVNRHEQLERDLKQVLNDHPELLEKARENLQHQLAALGEQADQLAQHQQSLARASHEAAKRDAQDSGLKQQQDQVLNELRSLLQDLKLPASDDMLIGGMQTARQAKEQLEKGNFANAQQQQRLAMEQLQETISKLKKNSELPAAPENAVKELQQRQQEISEAIEEIPEGETPEKKEKSARLSEEAAALRQAVERIPGTDETREARQQVLDRLREAANHLAASRTAEAKEQIQQADESLDKLAESIQSATQDPDKSKSLKSESAQKSTREVEEKSQKLLARGEELIRRQREITDRLEDVRAPTPDAKQPQDALPGEQAEAKTESSPSPGELADAQQELANQTRALGEAMKALGLPAEAINRSTSELSNITRATAHELNQVNFKRAAELSKEAAQKAQQLSEALQQKHDGTVPDRLRQQVEEVSQVQKAVADRLQMLADSKQQQAQFRSERQQNLQKQIQELSQQLGNRAEQLQLEQIDRRSQGELVQKGQGEAQAADQNSRLGHENAEKGNAGEAADMQLKAVESLRQSAQLTRQASAGGDPRKAPQDQAKGEAGKQVAESAQHLHQAGQQLAKLGEPAQPSMTERPAQEPGKAQAQDNQEGTPQQSPTDQQPDQMQQGQNGQANQDAGEGDGQGSSASKSLRDAAKNMRLAAEQMGLGSRAQRSNDPNQQGGRETGEMTGANPSDSAGSAEALLNQLNGTLGNVSQRNWGKLPGHLQTEMIEASQRRRDATYGSLIRRYFDEISRSRPAELKAPVQP